MSSSNDSERQEGPPPKPATLLSIYALDDEEHAHRLERALSMLRRTGAVETRLCRSIAPGADERAASMELVDSAEVVVLLVTAEFLDDPLCWDQWQRALSRHRAEKQVVVPLVLKDCDWRFPDMLSLRVLLRGARFDVVPLNQWPDSATAWQAVVDEIKAVLRRALLLAAPHANPAGLAPREPRVRFAVVWKGTVAENDLPMVEALVQGLDSVSEGGKLIALRAEPGSVRLVLTGTRAGFERIRALHVEGMLAERLGTALPAPLQTVEWEADVAGVFVAEDSGHPLEAAEKLKAVAVATGFEIADEVRLPSRPAVRSRPPSNLLPAIRERLEQLHPDGLYAHQAKALHLLGRRRDVCLATPTASGKSLIFTAAAADRLKRDPNARVLALYPLKALIQDQHEKWRGFLASLDMTCGYVDGPVGMASRFEALRSHRVLLMTPDVTHAWLMSNLSRPEVADFVANLRVLVLDEAHVYDGVFGTNMAYFIRRLRAISGIDTIISATATVGDPGTFVEGLTGRRPLVIGDSDDGSERRRKEVIVARPQSPKHFEQLVSLLVRLTESKLRFLAFADSRKLVEQLVARARQRAAEATGQEDLQVLPYRAGYEDEDRRVIQTSLAEGRLAGVVSTPALEVGLDIGDIGIVVLLGSPPSVKSFWQRIGRAGRTTDSACLVIDAQGLMTSGVRRLQGYLERPAEPGWLYLDNVFIRYAHALCAASEITQKGAGAYDKAPFDSLPEAFIKLLDNELHQTEPIPDDLYLLKQRAVDGPQHEFPLRDSTEKSFELKESNTQAARGKMTFSQVLREAYPGAIHYYMARAYRVKTFDWRTGEIGLELVRGGTTRPDSQTMVFPKLPGGVLSAMQSDAGFVVETALQVSQRVLGFVERQGATPVSHRYGPGSHYWRQPLVRLFQTTGVCWYFRDEAVLSDAVAEQLRVAFSTVCGIQERDLGVSMFHANPSRLWPVACQGMCIYDAVDGSLRLTSQLIARFDDVLREAIQLARAQETGDASIEAALIRLAEYVAATGQGAVGAVAEAGDAPAEGGWVRVIGPNQPAIYLDAAGLQREVQVIRHVFTTEGIRYLLVPLSGKSWSVPLSTVTPIFNLTQMIDFNPATGEERPAE